MRRIYWLLKRTRVKVSLVHLVLSVSVVSELDDLVHKVLKH